MIKFSNNIKYFIFLFFIKFFFINNVYSEQIKKIEIFGNDRLADETIVLFSNLEIGDNIDSNIINNTFKSLFETDYFKDLKINFESGNL